MFVYCGIITIAATLFAEYLNNCFTVLNNTKADTLESKYSLHKTVFLFITFKYGHIKKIVSYNTYERRLNQNLMDQFRYSFQCHSSAKERMQKRFKDFTELYTQ